MRDGAWRPLRWNVWFVIALLWVAFIVAQFWYANAEVETIPYSRYLVLEREGLVSDLRVSRNEITGTLEQPAEGEPDRFRTLRVDSDLADRLAEQGLEFTGTVEDTWLSRVLSWVVPFVLILAIWLVILRRFAGGGLGGGVMSVGKSKAKIHAEKSVPVSFGDVAGVDEVKEELREVIGFLRDPKRYGRLGARLPKGVLLVGPPGTGKTLLARAVAGEAGVPFFSISGSEFVELFVGVGAARVRDLFEQARARTPPASSSSTSSTRWAGPAGSARLIRRARREGADSQPAAGRARRLRSERRRRPAGRNQPPRDPRRRRCCAPGRFDRQVLVDRPDKPGRIAILKVHLQEGPASPATIDPAGDRRALTPGFTGADLANLVNEAAVVATRRDAEAALVAMEDFTAGQSSASLPASRSAIAAAQSRGNARSSLYHEMGHALVGMSAARHRQGASIRCRSSRAASAPSATRFSGRSRTAS